jgi:tRNA dimethylallyltransferase
MAVATSEMGRELGIELVSIDAMQVYRSMDIGTAKPSASDQSLVRHHLIDLVEARETFTVAEFQAAYRHIISDIAQRGATPLLVGGTGLYLRAVVDDLDIPGTWPEIRSRLEDEADRVGPERLHVRLETLDPRAAAKMEDTNTRRIVRALEVIEGSGRAFSSFGPGVDEYPVSGVRQIALRWDREVLRTRIADRVRNMVEAGLVDEVRGLLAGGLSRTARQALGYKEMIDFIEGRTDFETAVEAIIVHTSQFAVRQERWFRRDPRVTWFDVHEDPVSEVTPRIMELLA